MSSTDDLLIAFELHDPHRIRRALEAGASPTSFISGKRPIDLLIEMYTRSDTFASCVREMTAAGASVGNEVLEAILTSPTRDARLRCRVPRSTRVSSASRKLAPPFS